ncbi:MAG: hypothetical protein QOJ42_2831 [Acidobacteriaceae bacterium]|jgi:hypothetical protein|nr:hypothetical protein [Acidobacteriaceae bacterium]
MPIIEKWRQLPDGQIEFAIRYFPAGIDGNNNPRLAAALSSPRLDTPNGPTCMSKTGLGTILIPSTQAVPP